MNTPAMIMTKALSTVLGVSLLLLASFSYAEEELPKPVKAMLVSEVVVVTPGKPFKMGVFFEIIPDWHIYWKNSGDTGLPTKIEFELPSGFKTTELKWPIPNIYTRAGDITDYGYEDSVLLFTDVIPPDDLKYGSKVKLMADVSWVSCEEICIPGRVELDLTLSVSENEETTNTKLFREWKNTLPVKSSDKKSPFEIDIQNSDKENQELIRIGLLHNSTVRVTGLIPAPGENVSISEIQVERGGGGEKTDIELVKRLLPGGGSKDSELELLIVYENENEKREGVEVMLSPLGQH